MPKLLVDALVVIARHVQRCPLSRDCVDDGYVAPVQILIFVKHHVLKRPSKGKVWVRVEPLFQSEYELGPQHVAVVRLVLAERANEFRVSVPLLDAWLGVRLPSGCQGSQTPADATNVG